MGGWGRAWALILERDLGLVYEQGSEGSKRGHLGLSKAGSKGLFYIKKIPARVAVQRMFQNPGHVGCQPCSWWEGHREVMCPADLHCACCGVRAGPSQGPLSEDRGFPCWPDIGPGQAVVTRRSLCHHPLPSGATASRSVEQSPGAPRGLLGCGVPEPCELFFCSALTCVPGLTAMKRCCRTRLAMRLPHP